jgi:Ca2+/Na+ antiporter
MMYETRFDITENHYKEFLWSDFWHKQAMKYGVLFFLLMILFYIILLSEFSQFWIWIGMVLYAILLICVIYITMLIKIRRITKIGVKNYGKNIVMLYHQDTIEISYDMKGLPAKSITPYAAFKKVTVTKNLILLYRSHNIASLVPKNSLVQGNVEEFITFLKENIRRQNQ